MSRILIGIFCSCLLYVSSCTLTKPLPLNPFTSIDSVQTFEKTGLSRLNGDYEILSPDSQFLCTLDQVFVYSSLFDYRNKSTKNGYITLKAIDDNHLQATLFAGNKMVKTKTIKGRLLDNYFEFHTTHLKFRFIINVYEQQTNRLSLWKDGALYLDNNHGGIAFLVFMPIPLSGASIDTYHLKFSRKE